MLTRAGGNRRRRQVQVQAQEAAPHRARGVHALAAVGFAGVPRKCGSGLALRPSTSGEEPGGRLASCTTPWSFAGFFFFFFLIKIANLLKVVDGVCGAGLAHGCSSVGYRPPPFPGTDPRGRGRTQRLEDGGPPCGFVVKISIFLLAAERLCGNKKWIVRLINLELVRFYNRGAIKRLAAARGPNAGLRRASGAPSAGRRLGARRGAPARPEPRSHRQVF